MPVALPRRILQRLPDAWRAELAPMAVEPITSGMSGAEVFRLRTEPARFLKVADDDTAESLRQEIARTTWLAARGIRTAPILRSHDDSGRVAMQTQALPGEPADQSGWPKARVLTAIGRAVARLHMLAVTDCPFDERLAVRLERARRAVERDEVDADAFATRNRRLTPHALFARLVADQPPEDIVIAHGDLTLSNMIVDADGSIGFIDCGHAGRADRYIDLGVLAAEIADHFGRRAVSTFARAYGLQDWDARKAGYYADLYEFF